MKTLRQHINEHPDIKYGTSIAIVYSVEDILDMYTGEVTYDEALDVLRQLDKGAANEAIVSAIEGLIV